MASGLLGVSKCMHQWRLSESDECPWCGCLAEDAKHVITCPTKASSGQWNLAVVALKATMVEQETRLAITAAILARLSTIHGSKLRIPNASSPAFKAFQQQELVGWIPLIPGFPVED